MESRKSTTEVFTGEDRILLDEDEIALQEAINGLLQFDEVVRLVDEHAHERSLPATPGLILELNRIAIQGIRRSAGTFRGVPVEISNTQHVPPPHGEVPRHVAEMCQYINENWFRTGVDLSDAIHISAYLMWRLNWIHPFRDGNGRTSRALSYLAICTRLGRVLPGSPTIADQIVNHRQPYYSALDAADAAWLAGSVELSVMERLIRELLIKQLQTV